MRWKSVPVIAFDTETTGLSPWEGHRIVEFAGVSFEFDAQGELREDRIRRHQFLFNPGIPIPLEVQDLTGITNDAVADSPPFEKRATQIRALLEGAITVAHNYSFDQGFLDSEFQRIGMRWPTPLAEIDTVDLSRRFFPDAPRHKLEDLARRMDVSLEGAHRAVNDAEACGRSFLGLTRRFDSPDEIEGLIDWADAIGMPPATGQLRRSAEGEVVFGEGIFKGEPISRHPDHLAWMVVAKDRGPEGWRDRFPDSVRNWARRWLRIRAAGRAPQGSKSFGATDWGIDSCSLPDGWGQSPSPR